MDSLDYEALSHADVRRISETIRERGMNNMLAERIKVLLNPTTLTFHNLVKMIPSNHRRIPLDDLQDFLNRLVRDHGSIDLEWLRDVPPDKAK